MTQTLVLDPRGLLARSMGDNRFLLVLAPGLVMQVMHPVIAGAVNDHSAFRTDPWGRARRSMDSVLTWCFGGEQAAAEGVRLREMHKSIRGVDAQGRKYHALDAEAYAWVHGTAFERVVTMHRLFGAPLSPAEERALYAEVVVLGRILQVPEREVPPSVEEYWQYFDRMVATRLENTGVAQEVLAGVRDPLMPDVLPSFAALPWRPIGGATGRVLHLVAVGTLLPAFREILGLKWSRIDEYAFDALARTVRTGYPVLPDRLRYLPKAYRTLRTGHWDYGLPAAG